MPEAILAFIIKSAYDWFAPKNHVLAAKDLHKFLACWLVFKFMFSQLTVDLLILTFNFGKKIDCFVYQRLIDCSLNNLR